MGNNIKEICFYFFPYLIEHGRPLHQEVKFRFVIGHRIFNGKIDAVRLTNRKIVVEDYKTRRP